MTGNATSPASTGPAGSHFEGQVGAYYLLSMLIGAEPRGLPGTSIDKVELQRAAEGRPLDDVIVHAHDVRGNSAILEIQVKRSIAFTPTDQVFRGVVTQIVKAAQRADFWTSRYELAIAIARTSRKIDGAYQDVLTWARQIGDAATFIARIERSGSANNDMRIFVQTFRAHLRDAGSDNDDETVWKLLRRLKILVYDFTAQGSACEELAKERASSVLHPEDKMRAGDLWTNLIELALQIAASGGDRSRSSLIESLTVKSYRFAGDRSFSSTRAALGEASRAALSDISDQVGDVMLTRYERVASIHEALDRSRFVEIRGDAGVGKSGVLKHFAMQIIAESPAIVLSPGRCTPRGWSAMRAVIGFDGTAHDLLADLASDGGAILFVDNLDNFDEEEQKTAIDLVREASDIPGFAVVVTARRNFGVEEPSWLPSDAIDKLGRTAPIMIDELGESEIEELRHAAPQLAPLLANTHPARAVTRNLFRLARLAARQGSDPLPRTEIDMAEQWWQTADGMRDSDHRERARLLRALAEQALLRVDALDVSNHPAAAVDALVGSETLRDLGNDRVAFRHDVLREWAIANLILADASWIDRISLDRYAPAGLARGVELVARFSLERAVDSTQWRGLLQKFSGNHANGSWRRTVMLALVRSEIGEELLVRASETLLADDGSLVCELIRIVMAVDVEPASRLFAAAGVDAAIIPANLNVPSAPSWHRLILWLLSLDQNLPQAAVPDVVDLYTTWSMGTLGVTAFTPLLLQWLYRWLIEIEASRDAESWQDRYEPFNGKLDRDRITSLESNLRTGFLSFCNRTPALAAEYLQLVGKRRHNNDIIRSIVKFRGALAQAAPAELVELTVAALIPQPEDDRERYGHERREPFEFLDHDFLPPSPAQGPFLELLTHAAPHGLPLIRKLVDHSISYYSGGRPHGSDAIHIQLNGAEKIFPWVRSYAWSRDQGGPEPGYCVTSCLMALEAWAHRRIDAGESVEAVLADVIGPDDSPAAYLLIAVDILISHWPKSRDAAVPFLACPELLCLDRNRHSLDSFRVPDFFGFGALQKEPIGVASLSDLRKRTSRQYSLEALLGQIALFAPDQLRQTLVQSLSRAAERLGSPNDKSTFGDPEFMVAHALNLTDPTNWPEVAITMADGTERTAHQYVSPPSESAHLAGLQQAALVGSEDNNIQTAITLAVRDPTRSSPALLTSAVAWAKKARETTPSPAEEEDNHSAKMRKEAIVSAAMIVMRDGDVDLRTEQEAWARGEFAQALQADEDSVYRFRSGLQFNPVAIAFVGLIHILRQRVTREDTRALLEVAAQNPAAAHGFGAAIVALAVIDERLPCAVLRCAFSACIRPTREWDLPEEEVAARAERHKGLVRDAVNAELDWLFDAKPPPTWPAFPQETVHRRRHLRLPGRRLEKEVPEESSPAPNDHADHQAAALWLGQVQAIVDVAKRHWLREIAWTYRSWTATANGAGLDAHEEIDHPPREWNDAYFNLVAHCIPGLTPVQIVELALTPTGSLPDEAFFGAAARFLRSFDSVYFNDGGITESAAVQIRLALAQRMMSSRGWKRLASSRMTSIERHLGPAIAVLFFNDHHFIGPTKCYLFPKAIDQLDPFLPLLEQMINTGPSLFVALITLNLVEVSPRPEHLSLILMAIKSWLESYADNTEFWVDQGIGHRVCAWIEEIRRQDPASLSLDKAVRIELDKLLPALVKIGVAAANRLEGALTKA